MSNNRGVNKELTMRIWTPPHKISLQDTPLINQQQNSLAIYTTYETLKKKAINKCHDQPFIKRQSLSKKLPHRQNCPKGKIETGHLDPCEAPTQENRGI